MSTKAWHLTNFSNQFRKLDVLFLNNFIKDFNNYKRRISLQNLILEKYFYFKENLYVFWLNATISMSTNLPVFSGNLFFRKLFVELYDVVTTLHWNTCIASQNFGCLTKIVLIYFIADKEKLANKIKYETLAEFCSILSIQDKYLRVIRNK